MCLAFRRENHFAILHANIFNMHFNLRYALVLLSRNFPMLKFALISRSKWVQANHTRRALLNRLISFCIWEFLCRPVTIEYQNRTDWINFRPVKFYSSSVHRPWNNVKMFCTHFRRHCDRVIHLLSFSIMKSKFIITFICISLKFALPAKLSSNISFSQRHNQKQYRPRIINEWANVWCRSHFVYWIFDKTLSAMFGDCSVHWVQPHSRKIGKWQKKWN